MDIDVCTSRSLLQFLYLSMNHNNKQKSSFYAHNL